MPRDKRSVVLDTEHTALQVGETGDCNILLTAFGGHCFYCIKSVTGQQHGDNFFDREIDGVVLPRRFTNLTNQLKVVGRGPNVGKPCSKFHRKKHARPRHLPNTVKIGDVVICPEQDPGILMSPLWPEIEFFIEESVPICVIPREMIGHVRSST